MSSSPSSDSSARERLCEATLRLIGAEGLDAVRHRRVAAAAGVSPGSATYHFDRREDLIEEAFVWYLGEATGFLAAVEARHARRRSPVRAMVAYLEDLIESEFEEPDLIQAEHELLLYAARHPSLAARVRAWDDERHRHLTSVLEGAGAADPASGARTLMALVRGIEVERLLQPDRTLDLRRRLTPVVEAIADRRGRSRPSSTPVSTSPSRPGTTRSTPSGGAEPPPPAPSEQQDTTTPDR